MRERGESGLGGRGTGCWDVRHHRQANSQGRRGVKGRGFRPTVFALTHRCRNGWRAAGHRQKKLRGETSYRLQHGDPYLGVFMRALRTDGLGACRLSRG